MRTTPSVRRAGTARRDVRQDKKDRPQRGPALPHTAVPHPTPPPPPEVGSHGYAGSAYLLQLAEPPTDSSPYASAVTSKYLHACARLTPVREYLEYPEHGEVPACPRPTP